MKDRKGERLCERAVGRLAFLEQGFPLSKLASIMSVRPSVHAKKLVWSVFLTMASFYYRPTLLAVLLPQWIVLVGFNHALPSSFRSPLDSKYHWQFIKIMLKVASNDNAWPVLGRGNRLNEWSRMHDADKDNRKKPGGRFCWVQREDVNLNRVLGCGLKQAHGTIVREHDMIKLHES